MIQPVILCGGKGSRLWPLSRELYPKQYLSFFDETTLFQQTVSRALSIDSAMAPLVVCNTEHRFFVAEQLQKMEVHGEIVLEPEGKNTAPAVAVSAYMKEESDPLLLVMPADHLLDIRVFAQALQSAIPLADAGKLVAFGIAPDRPETGYGYLEKGDALKGGFCVTRFAEKPSADVAGYYVASGRYLWNSGIFLFRASVYLKELAQFDGNMANACKKAVESCVTDLDFIRLGEIAFAASPSDSIDCAVMEKTNNCAMVILEDSGWSDLGSWSAMYDAGIKDRAGNVQKGDVLLHQTEGCYIHSESRLISAVGVSDLVIVETSDAVLVANKSYAQDVKQVVTSLRKEDREEVLCHKKVCRPWGEYQSIDKDARFQVKRITVKPGQVLSLQKHHHRAEHWVVVSGTAKITNGENEFILTENQSTYIPVGEIHRLENPGCIPLEIIEVQTGSYLGEDDIVRFDDIYGRREVK